MKKKSWLALLLCICLGFSIFSACGGKSESGGSATQAPQGNQNNNQAGKDSTVLPEDFAGDAAGDGQLIPFGIEAEITYMVYSGEDKLYKDVGKQTWGADAFNNANQGMAFVVASAVEFNKIYPNVIVNIMNVSFDHDGTDDLSFHQCVENAKNDFGIYPDIWTVHSLIDEILIGNVSDLSKYKDEDSYKVFNPSLMSMMNYHGFQGGLPAWVCPWGVFVNKKLAENNNIDVPPINWTMDQYTEFIAQADMQTFLGDIDSSTFLIDKVAKGIDWSLTNEGVINLDTDEVRRLVDLTEKQARYTAYQQAYLGTEPAYSITDNNWWWSTQMFAYNLMLANVWDSWSIGSFATSDPNGPHRMEPGTWDLYPIPSSRELPNTMQIVFDPVVIRNFANDSGDTAKKLDAAYAFAAFHNGDSRAWHARASWVYNVIDENTGETRTRTAMAGHGSLPLTQGPAFNEQMELWYSTIEHQSLKDKNMFPGFHYLMEIYETGQFWCTDGRTFPKKYIEDGTVKDALEEWDGIYWPGDSVGVHMAEPGWADQVKSRLADWTISINRKLELARQEVKNALVRYYNFKL